MCGPLPHHRYVHATNEPPDQQVHGKNRAVKLLGHFAGFGPEQGYLYQKKQQNRVLEILLWPAGGRNNG